VLEVFNGTLPVLAATLQQQVPPVAVEDPILLGCGALSLGD